ncbi:hypothetical protein KSP39_PZI003808 [Platanthera zijinensis]|uniref:soluble epoxide hydrolase n=1 Tax=Platanthera zijinensis TaxID=2320716 RepID=A0AAP0GD24_9ASPA
MHVAEKGEGPVVLLLHGFPELWYSWRHQILSLAARGYRAVAPDLRGYGDTEAPADVGAYSIFHIVGDLVALIESLGQDQVFVVGHDWGAIIAWNLCAFRPEKVKALVNLSVAFFPRKRALWRIDTLRALYGDDFYICRFQSIIYTASKIHVLIQEAGEVEAEFGQIDTAFLLKSFLTSRNPGPFYIPKEKGLSGRVGLEIPLPAWLSEADVNYFASKFDKTGFAGPINYYRNINRNWELTAPWADVQINVPAKFIAGDLDLAYRCGGMEEYIHNGEFKKDVPFLEEVVIMEGVGHFITQEKAQEVSDHIYDFIRKF